MNNIIISISPIRQMFTGLKLACCSSIVTFLLFSSPELSFPNTKEITPERDISVVRHALQSPDWKVLWDGARILVREKQFVLASDAYAQLFSIKPNIEEANWEYCKILLQTNSYKTASKIIALLLEKSPTKSEYLLVAGQVAAHEKNYSEAERYFGLIFEKSPTGKYADAALEGLAYSLRERGLKQLAYPLMQQLTTRDPSNKKLIHDMALDAISLKRLGVARQLYRSLLQEPDIDDRVIFQAASVFEESGFEKERDEIYKRYLKLHPDYIPFRMKMIEVSESRSDYKSLMDHLSYLIENLEDKDEFLLKAADVSLKRLNRPDKALVYLERYHTIHPENRGILTEISELQEMMAQDFLSIVENGGAELLWTDLASIGGNRQLIFMRMAELLEINKKYTPLINVLEVLHINGVNQYKISAKLAKLHYDRQNYETSFQFLGFVPLEDQDYVYFELRAEVELKLGMEVAALESLQQCLAIQPLLHNQRRKAIELAGDLGRVDIQIELFNGVAKSDFAGLPDNLLLTHIKMLSQNKIFGQALDLCERSIASRKESAKLLDFNLLQTEILRESDRKRYAEQILRQLLHDQSSQATVLLQLVGNALDDNDILSARKWFSQFERRKNNFLTGEESILLQRKKLLTNARLLRLEGDAAESKNLIDQALLDTQNIRSYGSKWYYSSLLKELYKLYLAEGDFLAADKLLESSRNELEVDSRLVALRLMYNDPNVDKKDTEGVERYIQQNGKIVISKAFDVVEQEIENHDYKSAEDIISQIVGQVDNSIRLKNIKIELSIASGDYASAIQGVEELEKIFPAESSFCRQSIEIIAKTGNYDKALDTLMVCFPGSWSVEGSNVAGAAGELEIKILYARLLWGAKRFEESLEVYSELLETPVYLQLINEFKKKNIDYQYLTRHQTFWSSMLLLVESDPEIIAELMEPTFLIDNIGSKTGEVVSSFYELYSWQSLIGDEFLARKATFNKKYHFAVKSYEKLVEQEETTENKVELAAIYGRIGEYRKEAQVYEEITNEGDVTPELKESIKRNILQIRPTNTIDAELEERDGRQGVVDIRKTSIGTSFWFTPDLDKDFWFKYAYNNYQSTEREGEIASNILLGAMTYEFGDSYELIAGLGVEKFNDSSDSEVQYNFELNGQLDDFISGFVLYQKAPIDDTIAAINDDIFRQYIQTGLTIESEMGITFGGDIQYSLYSDDNERNRFYGFSSYSIFGESLQFDVRYSYQYLANKDINGPDGLFSVDVNDDFVTTYWSPESYSEHRIGLQFKKDFFGYLTDLENNMSYFRFDTGISLEDEENVAYSAKFDIFLEMSPHLLLKGNFSFNSSDVYNEKMLSLSLHYSW